MSSSGSQNQEEEWSRQDEALRGLPSRGLDSNETNTRSCNNTRLSIGGSTQIRAPSTSIHQDTIPSYGVSVRPAGQPQPVRFDGLSYDFGIQPGGPPSDTFGSIDIHQLNPFDTCMFDAFPARNDEASSLSLISNDLLPTMNTHPPNHVRPSEHFQSSLVNHPALSEYTARDNLLVQSSFPPISIPQFDNQPDAFQPRSYQHTPAQGQHHSTSMAPSSSWNSLSGPPPEAASTSRVTTLDRPNNQEETQIRTILASPGAEIKLGSPVPPEGETVVEVRRDACVTLRFDMAKISQRISTQYAGLKVPRTISVKNSENTSAHKLLGLRILVFGTTSGRQYELICDDCRKKENRPGSLSLIDFRSRSDVVLPLRNDDRGICISFSFHCYPKHYNNCDPQYRLEVLLCEQGQQDPFIIRYRLPYTFNVVAKKRARDLSPPRRNTRRRITHRNSPVRPPTSGSARPSTQDQLSSGSSGALGNVSSTSQPNNLTVPSSSARDLLSPPPHADLTRPVSIPVPTASVEDPMDGQNAVIEGTNPGRGPTTGGIEIWIYGTNLPNGSTPLYARFGENVTRVNTIQAGLLSCKLPSRNSPCRVPVALSRAPTADSPPLGESLCKFEYYEHLNEAVAILVHILKNSNQEQAAALELLVKRANSPTRENGDGGRGDQGGGGGVSDHDIERAMIQALEPLQDMPKFDELVSITNDYNQTLAHFAVMFRHLKLLRRLVEWEIDLTIADVNGLTPLHCAYRGGEKAFIDLLLDAGAPENVMDALGRTPAHLMPAEFEASDIVLDALGRHEAFDSSMDHDTDMASGCQPEFLEQRLDALSIYESTDSGHGASDSDDEKSVDGDEGGCQGRLEPMDVCYPTASTSKAAVRGPINPLQWEGGVQIRKIRRIPDVPNDADVNSLIPELRERLVDPESIEYLRKEVFPTGQISLPALQAPMCQSDEAQFDEATQKYHGLLLNIENSNYKCRLCPKDNELSFEDDREALHHITKSHLDMGYGCQCGCGKTFWNTRDLKRHERSLKRVTDSE